MTSVADQLMERRAALVKDMQNLASGAVQEGRDLSSEEQSKFDAMNAEVDALATRAQSIIDGETRAKELEDSFRKVTGREPEERGNDAESEFAKWARDESRGAYDIPAVRGLLTRLTESRRAEESRDMSGAGGLGKAGVYGQLWEYALAASELLQAGVTLFDTSDGNTIPMPKATAHADVDGAVLNPNDPVVESDSTITTVDLSVSKYGFITNVPNELIQDATFDLEGYLARNAGRRLGNKVAAIAAAAAASGFTTAGVTSPAGVLTNLGSQDTAGQGSDLLIDLFHSVLPAYRTGAMFGMNDQAAAVVRKLKTSTGEPVWQPALVAGDPDMVLGKPVKIVPEFDGFAASKKPIFFGDWSALYVRIAGGLRFERSTDAGFENDQTKFRGIVRTGSVAIDPNAVKHLATPAA
ncbi:phage major capsid protein [Nocardioides panaciterrulae]|uniref:HK97 family phage major capsid protein n=1 Tax=Nocardioides panaciterrulae TaxID=661492 RepID=A0A7Y9EA68_9ACTN|nr:phage major capsid protein [Nocardioides panaciterrulae]NYD43938.1 HK97 family phage major capsid protein [Nocardioides panaciterrulae]NYD44007.1 HK97 family phage major capsid protein [Nocardioides panaciterrulae]